MKIKFQDETIIKYMKEQAEHVNAGRKITDQIEKLEKELEKLRQKEYAITSKVTGGALGDECDVLTKKLNELAAELNDKVEQVKKIKIDAIPLSIKKRHQEIEQEIKAKAEERRKVAHKVQKIKDRVIPKLRKAMKQYLKDEYDDYDTAKLVGNQIEATIFNHLENWKNKFKKGEWRQ